MGNSPDTVWLSGEREQEQVIKSRLTTGLEVTFKKQIWRETAHGKTHHPLALLLPSPALVFYSFYVSLQQDTPPCSQLSTLHERQVHLTGSNFISSCKV